MRRAGLLESLHHGGHAARGMPDTVPFSAAETTAAVAAAAAIAAAAAAAAAATGAGGATVVAAAAEASGASTAPATVTPGAVTGLRAKRASLDAMSAGGDPIKKKFRPVEMLASDLLRVCFGRALSRYRSLMWVLQEPIISIIEL